MANLLMSIPTAKSTRNYIAGVVTGIRVNSDEKHPYIIEVKAPIMLEGQTEAVTKTVQLQCWENSKYSCIERVRKMNIQPGSFILARGADMKTYQPRTGDSIVQMALYSIMYTGAMAHEGKIIFSGYVNDIEEHEDGSALLKVSYPTYDRTTNQRANVELSCPMDSAWFEYLKACGLSQNAHFAAAGVINGGNFIFERCECAKNERQNQQNS